MPSPSPWRRHQLSQLLDLYPVFPLYRCPLVHVLQKEHCHSATKHSHTHIHIENKHTYANSFSVLLVGGEFLECPGTLSGNSCLCWWACRAKKCRGFFIFVPFLGFSLPPLSNNKNNKKQQWPAATFPDRILPFSLHTFRITEFFRAQALKNMLNIEWIRVSGAAPSERSGGLNEWVGGGCNNAQYCLN